MPDPGWYEVVFTVAADRAESAEAALYGCGAIAVTLQDAGDQPLLEPAPGETPLWEAARITGLFDGTGERDTLYKQLKTALGSLLADDETMEVRRLDDRCWERSWMDDYQPMHFGRRLSVYPGHITPDDPQRCNLILDPGLAFGTGTHPTTALCLRWLDAHLSTGQSCIDYGCGSGILATAAARLGADPVYATDIDPQALTAARQNAGRNGVAGRVHIYPVDAIPDIQADIVLANILSNTLIDLAGILADRLKPGGTLLLSGILRDQAGPVKAAFAPAVTFGPDTEEQEWVLLSGVKTG